MKEIAHKDYQNALEIVNAYHKQILYRDKKVEQKLKHNHFTVPSSGLLKDFLTAYTKGNRISNALKKHIESHYKISFNECTVEQFLENFLEEVKNTRYSAARFRVSDISNETVLGVLIKMAMYGYNDYVVEFEEYL